MCPGKNVRRIQQRVCRHTAKTCLWRLIKTSFLTATKVLCLPRKKLLILKLKICNKIQCEWFSLLLIFLHSTYIIEIN